MTPTEAVDLVTYVAACCPSMRMEPGTPDAWYRLLSDLDITDCLTAVEKLAKTRPYIAVSDIRDQVRSLREDRINHGWALEPPPADARNYTRELHARIIDLASRRDLTRAITPPAGGPPPEGLRDAKAKTRVTALTVACPWCDAGPNQPCTIPGTGLPLTQAGVHDARLRALADRPQNRREETA